MGQGHLNFVDTEVVSVFYKRIVFLFGGGGGVLYFIALIT